MMYNRYMPPHNSFRPVEHEMFQNSKRHTDSSNQTRHQKPPDSDPLGELTGGIRNYLAGIFEGFSLQSLDSSDILLLLIILFLYLEGDNLDLVIALGIMLLLSFGTSASTDSSLNEAQSHPVE